MNLNFHCLSAATLLQVDDDFLVTYLVLGTDILRAP